MSGLQVNPQDKLAREIEPLAKELDRERLTFGVFLGVVIVASGLLFFIEDYRRHGGAGWPWWEKVGGFAGAMFGAAFAVCVLWAIALSIVYFWVGHRESVRRFESAKVVAARQRELRATRDREPE